VLLDNIHSVDKDGKSHDRPLTAPELEHVTQLVKDAVGFDESRGDSVNVVNSSFQADAPAPETQLEQVPMWERPLFQNLLKLGAGLIVLLVLALAVLRPMVRALVAPARAVLAPSSADDPALAAPARQAGNAATPAEPMQYEQQVTHARTLVGQDPKRVAQVVRSWVGTDE